MLPFKATALVIALGLISSFSFSTANLTSNIRSLATNSTSGRISCSLCPNGSTPTYPNTTVTVPWLNQDISCADLNLLIKAQQNATAQSCQLSQLLFGSQCGCPVINITGSSCPGVCSSDGALPTHPSRILPFDLTGTYNYGISCLQAHLYSTQQLSANDTLCQFFKLMGQYCGCNNSPQSCTPCYGNTIMPDYTKKINPAGKLVSCGEYALSQYSQSIMKNGKYNSTICGNLQSAGSALCDCPTLPSIKSATCSLCNENQTLLSNATYNYALLNFNLTCDRLDTAISDVPTADCAAGVTIYPDVLKTCCSNNQTSSAWTMSRFIGREAFLLLILAPWMIVL